MIVLDLEQGTQAWLQARAGVVTASEADNIVTPGKLLAAKGEAYLNRLVAEVLLGCPVLSKAGATSFAERGHDLEASARAWYELDRDVTVETVGFITSDDGRLGCSPDGLIGEEGGLEVKIPEAGNHVFNLRHPDEFVIEHRGQVQFGLWLTGRKWWHLMSYNPALTPLVMTCLPDADYFRALDANVPKFLARLDEAVALLRPAVEDARAANPFL